MPDEGDISEYAKQAWEDYLDEYDLRDDSEDIRSF